MSELVDQASPQAPYQIAEPPPLKITRRGTKYPDPQTPFGQAWSFLWQLMSREYPKYVDGVTMTQLMVDETGLVQRATMDVFLSHAAKAGLLDRKLHVVVGTRGARNRAKYRIADKFVQRAES